MVLRVFDGPNCCGGRPDVFAVYHTYDLQMPGPEWAKVLSLHIKRYKGNEFYKCLLPDVKMS